MFPNRKIKGTPAASGLVVYAKGCNPDTDNDYYDNKVVLFGENDGLIRIPTEWLLIAEQNNNTEFKVKLSATSVTLVSTFIGNRPKTLIPGMIFTLYEKSYELIKPARSRGAWLAKQLNDNQNYKVTPAQLKQAMFKL